jgi:hypothetical protein
LVGTRVRHHGQQFARARREGTGNILEVKGPWPDGSYEYLVRTSESFAHGTGPDNPETRETWWASHTTIPLTPEEQL